VRSVSYVLPEKLRRANNSFSYKQKCVLAEHRQRLHIFSFAGLHKHMKNKHLGIPYWDWLEDGWNNLPELVKDSYVFDPILKRYMKNPFYRTYLYDHPLENNKTVCVSFKHMSQEYTSFFLQ